MRFCFGDIVVVEDTLIGVVVKDWINMNGTANHDVYVREFNSIKNYQENEMERYMVRHKFLDEKEQEYQDNGVMEGDMGIIYPEFRVGDDIYVVVGYEIEKYVVDEIVRKSKLEWGYRCLVQGKDPVFITDNNLLGHTYREAMDKLANRKREM